MFIFPGRCIAGCGEVGGVAAVSRVTLFCSSGGVLSYNICILSTAKDNSRKIVVETKYYKIIFHTRIGRQEKLISANLYQLYAYLKNLETRGGVDSNCEGILLYAVVDQDADFRFSLPCHDLRVKTLDLDRAWQEIHDKIFEIES